MRISAATDPEAHRYTVYDHALGCSRKDLVWADDVTSQVGVGFASAGAEHVLRVEQRKHVLIVTALYWVALDLPPDRQMVSDEVAKKEPEHVYVDRSITEKEK